MVGVKDDTVVRKCYMHDGPWRLGGQLGSSHGSRMRAKSTACAACLMASMHGSA